MWAPGQVLRSIVEQADIAHGVEHLGSTAGNGEPVLSNFVEAQPSARCAKFQAKLLAGKRLGQHGADRSRRLKVSIRNFTEWTLVGVGT